jgi:hypothetical protein
MAESFVGIDVSLHHLDVHIRPSAEAARYPNDEAGIRAVVARLADLGPTRVVLEATAASRSSASTPARPGTSPRRPAGWPRRTPSTPPAWPTWRTPSGPTSGRSRPRRCATCGTCSTAANS